jgi:rRNA-processing protein FCF1
MSHTPPIYLLTDANILIDLAQANALHFLRMLTQAGIATIMVPHCVYAEARSEIDETSILECGLIMVHESLETKIKAVAIDEKGLSDTDKTLLQMAMECHYSIWTNDGTLHKKCKAYDILAYWEFEVLLKLYEIRLVAANNLLELADTLETINPRMKGMREKLSKDL